MGTAIGSWLQCLSMKKWFVIPAGRRNDVKALVERDIEAARRLVYRFRWPRQAPSTGILVIQMDALWPQTPSEGTAHYLSSTGCSGGSGGSCVGPVRWLFVRLVTGF